MDVKRRIRQARAIAQLAALFDEHGIKTWLGGGWALEALDPTYKRDHIDVDFHVFAADAPTVRCMLEEQGFNIVDVTANSFVAERGKLRIEWELLWYSENDETVTYDNKLDRTYVWPEGAFPNTKAGTIDDVSVYVMSPSAQRRHKLDYDREHVPLRQKDMKDLSRLKALIHDRM